MAQTHDGAMRVLARRAGVTVEELRARQAAGEKWCYRCARWRGVNAFCRDRSRYDGLTPLCADCRSNRTAPGPTIRERRQMLAFGHAWCRGCEAWLPIAEVTQGACRRHHAAGERFRYATNPAYNRSRRHRSAQRRRGVAPVPAIAQEVLTEQFGGLCAYCDSPATGYDHLVPVSKGGATEPRFIVPCCASCNSRKKDKTLDEWLATVTTVKHELIDVLVMQDCWPC